MGSVQSSCTAGSQLVLCQEGWKHSDGSSEKLLQTPDGPRVALLSQETTGTSSGTESYARCMGGTFGQNHHVQYSHIPELFLYSNKDFYVSAKYLEREVIDRRRKQGKPFTAVRFQGFRHVQHYRKHKDQYEAAVTEFLRKSFGRVEEMEEMEEEEEEVGIIQRGRRAMERGPQPSVLSNHSFGV